MEEEINELRADWLAHPYTLGWLKASQENAEKAKKQLFADCSKSDDAVVRAAYAKYIELEVVAEWFRTGGKKK